jgi:hypothetical protein
MTRFIALFALWLLISATLSPPEKWKQVRVYVALCDNESQGIVPVPAKIGNCNDPDQNLYWGENGKKSGGGCHGKIILQT